MSKPVLDKNINIPDNVLRSLLTPSELRMLKNRWHILSLLEQGQTVRAIAEQVQVGTDTVVRVARMTERGNTKKASKKVEVAKSRVPWIFGKSD